jgi:bacterioferritin-associated ferredoxin
VLQAEQYVLTSPYMALLCHCASVRSVNVVDAVRAGAQSLDDVTRLTGAAGNCGGCRDAVCEVMALEIMKPSHVPVRIRQETVHAS